jgi:hypothetical protein
MSIFHYHHVYEMEGNKSNQKTKKTILAGLFLGVHCPKATEPIVDLYEVQGKNSKQCTPFPLCGTILFLLWYYIVPSTIPQVQMFWSFPILKFVPEDVSFLLSLNHQTEASMWVFIKHQQSLMRFGIKSLTLLYILPHQLDS